MKQKGYSPINKALLLNIFGVFDKKLKTPLQLVVGGAGALMLAYKYDMGTYDIDAVPFRTTLSPSEIEGYSRQIARKFHLPPDWLNPYFQTFSYVLPKSYGERLISVYKGKFLQVYVLGPEDLLILKCFARREKDIGHCRLLMKHCQKLDFVDQHLQRLKEEGISKAQEACDFFDDLRSDLGL